MTIMVLAQLAVFPLIYFVWRREGKPRPFNRWLHGVAFNKRAVEALYREEPTP